MLTGAVLRCATRIKAPLKLTRSYTSVAKKRAAVLWSGGKDCSLALYKGLQKGYSIEKLVTFTPTAIPDFKVHSPALIKEQSACMKIPHSFVVIQAPYEASYRSELRKLKENDGIDVVLTGDIDIVCSDENWIQKCAEGTGIEVDLPLWQMNRRKLLDELLEANFELLVTAVDCKRVPQWEKLLNRRFDSRLVDEIAHLEPPIDVCGEHGEYHTMILNGPMFASRLPIESFAVTTKQTGRVAYLEFLKESGKM